MHDELCSCGSGRVFVRCHGDPVNEFARVQALSEARQIALLFPSARLRNVDELAESLARELADADEIDSALETAMAEVGGEESSRLVDEWSEAYPDRWASLCHTADDIAAAEHEFVKGALTAAVHERLPTPRELLVELETFVPVSHAAPSVSSTRATQSRPMSSPPERSSRTACSCTHGKFAPSYITSLN